MDIFDKIMQFKIMKPFRPFYEKYKEVLLYIFFGGLTFCVSIASYSLLYLVFHINELIANIISWILAVWFAYVTNRKWVFESQADNVKKILIEIFSFFSGRIATLVIEELILFVFITCCHFNGLIVKIIAQIIVIVLNYIISKLFIFKKNSR